MKFGRGLRPATVAVALAAAAWSGSVAYIGAQPAQTPADRGMLAGEAFKNVQAMKDVPVDDFLTSMGLMCAALGNDCADCHQDAGTQYVDWAADPPRKIIARRMVIFASEDIGLAQPTALVVANAVFQAVTTIGMPECIHNLAHGVAFLSNAAKDRSSTDAIGAAMEDAKKHGNLPVPMEIRNAPTKLMKDLGYGKRSEGDSEDLLPKKLAGRKYIN